MVPESESRVWNRSSLRYEITSGMSRDWLTRIRVSGIAAIILSNVRDSFLCQRRVRVLDTSSNFSKYRFQADPHLYEWERKWVTPRYFFGILQNRHFLAPIKLVWSMVANAHNVFEKIL